MTVAHVVVSPKTSGKVLVDTHCCHQPRHLSARDSGCCRNIQNITKGGGRRLALSVQ
jgi:hypothetical protein